MHSPFHAIITTPVLDVRELARSMRHYSARAGLGAARGCRDEEEDAVLLGRLLMLDELGWRREQAGMGEAEVAALRAAGHELGRAVEILTGRIAGASRGGGDADAMNEDRDGEDG